MAVVMMIAADVAVEVNGALKASQHWGTNQRACSLAWLAHTRKIKERNEVGCDWRYPADS